MRRSSGGATSAALTILIVLAMIAGGVWVLWTRCGLRGCPDVALLSGYAPDEASVVVDSDGEELAKLYRVRRIVVSIDELPEYVPHAFVAIEDRRFWEHNGVDWPRVAGAAWVNVRSRRFQEGFSTITMQLARNVFPDRLPQNERTVSRKLSEMRVAMEIERRHSKSEILELYLNQIYFGRGAWGIEAASHEYFDKPASELTLGEAALLAGMIRAPSRLDPRQNRELALGRRGVVLAAMVELGQISPEEAAEAAEEELELARGEAPDDGERAPYFVEEVRQFLEGEFGDALYTGGYTVHTTLEAGVQAAAEEELARQLAAIEAGRYGAFRHPARGAGGSGTGEGADGEPDPGPVAYLQGAMVVIDAESGDVLAMVGGRAFDDSRFNRVTQARRQPGSAFKPFVYAAGLAAGLPPSAVLRDEPLRRVLDDGTVWEPGNYGGSYAGAVSMRDALVHSRNVATIRLAEQVGLGRVIDMAKRLGLSGPIPSVPSVAIGAAETTLLELSLAYAAFATLGRRPEPRMVTRVEDRDGRVVWESEPRTERVLDPAVAFLITDMMRDVLDRGTGTPVRGVGFRGAAAGKTGTTNGATDVWFIGYTPRRVAGVWIGFDSPSPIVAGATGGALAAPVWGRVMSRAGADGEGGWAPPAGVETRMIDAAGNLVGEGCPTAGPAREEYFLAGTAPVGRCGPGMYPWPDSARLMDSLGVDPDEDDGRPWWRRLWPRGRGEPGRDATTPPPVPPAYPPPSPEPDEPARRPAEPPRDPARSGSPGGRPSPGDAGADSPPNRPSAEPRPDPPGDGPPPARPAPGPARSGSPGAAPHRPRPSPAPAEREPPRLRGRPLIPGSDGR